MQIHNRLVVLALWGATLATSASAAGFELKSPSVKPGAMLSQAQVFKGFGCDGGNQSPALQWQGAPKGTKSYAITVYDPDAPTGSGWWHWVAYNIPANVTALPEGAGAEDGSRMPAGTVQGRTDFGSTGFGGACPPQGDKPHRYQFVVHALKVEKLELPPDASAALVGFMINANRLGKASLQARFGR
ncbi:YbhB/YbcL family Raf kinase inhibitor-like protein [Hydrogenophaga sp.]|uniref:YbhB/YbcL family Raf kinase inhibitor-like protein n=1 Tax=Hydrogenophaga sp. TaxID=1904254 RepID=UPI00356560B2